MEHVKVVKCMFAQHRVSKYCISVTKPKRKRLTERET